MATVDLTVLWALGSCHLQCSCPPSRSQCQHCTASLAPNSGGALVGRLCLTLAIYIAWNIFTILSKSVVHAMRNAALPQVLPKA